MTKTNNPTKKLMSLNDMFGLDESNKSKSDKDSKISIDLLVPFAHHPFKLYSGERFDDMVQSVKEFGVLSPLLVRPLGSQYEILAGHNRWNAARKANLQEVPVIIMEGLSDDDAMLIVTETNLIQRSFTDLSHSERAHVIAQHHKSLKNQGRRTDILNEIKMLLNADEIRDESTSSPVGKKLTSMDKSGKEYGLSKNSVARYLRINELNEELKEWIDSEEISIRAGVELSYLSNESQLYLFNILNSKKCKIDMKLASDLRSLEEKGKLSELSMTELIFGKEIRFKKPVSIFKGIKIKPKTIKKYFNETQSLIEVEGIIDKALEFYYQNNEGENKMD